MADEDSRRDASLGGREGSDGPQAAEPHSAAEGQPHAGKKGRRTRVLAGVLVALLLAVVLAVVALMPRGSGQAPATSEPEAQPITLTFVTPNYDESTDSKIPLEVRGRTAADAEYDETFYVSPSTPQLEVPAGTYELSLPASPLLATGDVYVLPEPVALDTKAVAGDGAAAPEVAFEVKPAEDVTKEDVDAAKAAAQASGFDAGRVEDLASTVVRRQVAALYGGILDNVRDVDFSSGAKDGFAPQAFAYALQDINGDGAPDLLVSGDKDGIQRYCAWVGSPDGSGVTQVEVPEDLVTRKGYASSLQFLLSGSNVGDGLLYSQVLGSGAAIPTTQRYVVRDGALVAEGDPILSQSTTQLASEVLAESVELAFVDVSDRSPLESYAKDGEVVAPSGEKGQASGAQASGSGAQGQSAGAASDAAISDAKARDLVVLAGTVRTVSGSDAIDLCESVGAMSSSEAAATRSFFTSTYPKALTETYTVFVLDEPQEIAWGEPGEGLSTDGRKTYVVSLGSDLGSYDGQHVTAAFDNSRSAWASQSNPLGKSPSCSSVEVLAVG
ncbi:hypothetical protein ACTM8Z_08440 [Atopobiaceae bacterium HCP3S3_D6]